VLATLRRRCWLLVTAAHRRLAAGHRPLNGRPVVLVPVCGVCMVCMVWMVCTISLVLWSSSQHNTSEMDDLQVTSQRRYYPQCAAILCVPLIGLLPTQPSPQTAKATATASKLHQHQRPLTTAAPRERCRSRSSSSSSGAVACSMAAGPPAMACFLAGLSRGCCRQRLAAAALLAGSRRWCAPPPSRRSRSSSSRRSRSSRRKWSMAAAGTSRRGRDRRGQSGRKLVRGERHWVCVGAHSKFSLSSCHTVRDASASHTHLHPLWLRHTHTRTRSVPQGGQPAGQQRPRAKGPLHR
jgi:hypothetical protein